jgi:hypothetical protein
MTAVILSFGMIRKKKEKEERKTRMGMALFWFNLWCHVSSYTKTEKKKKENH